MSQRFLLVQLADIGDLILATPALAALREAHPSAQITLLAHQHSAAAIRDTGLVDSIITLDRKISGNPFAFFRPDNLLRLIQLRRSRFDAVIFFHHFTLPLGTIKFAIIALLCGAKQRIGLENGRGWFLTQRRIDEGFGARHQAQYWLDLVALVGAESKPRPAHMRVDSGKVSLLPAGGKKIVIHPGSGGYSLARRWIPEAFAQLSDQLIEEEAAQIILVGTEKDGCEQVKAAMRHDPLDLTGQTSLSELAGIIRASDLFIGAESGVMHLAAAAGTPLVAIFGPGNPAAWGPWTPESPVVIVRSAPECSPCSYVEHGIGLREGCAARTCIRMVTVEQVKQAARQMLAGKRPPLPDSYRPQRPNRLRILGLPVDSITYAEWMERIGGWVAEGKRAHHVCTTNPEFMMIARKDSNFRSILKRADLCIPDGVGLLWAARRLGSPLPERVTGSDGLPIIAEYAAKHGWKLYFLGAAPGIAQKAADLLREKHPGLLISGVYPGSPAPEEEDSLVERINGSGADILLVAYGAPEQDKWIARNLPRLQVKMAMGVGGAFDFIAGVVPRAPLWMRRSGLEWLFRLYKQPWRIIRMTRLPRFVLAVLWEQRRKR